MVWQADRDYYQTEEEMLINRRAYSNVAVDKSRIYRRTLLLKILDNLPTDSLTERERRAADKLRQDISMFTAGEIEDKLRLWKDD